MSKFILNVHGYKGSAKNSAYLALREAFDCEVVSPEIDYDAMSPNQVFDKLLCIVCAKGRDNLMGVVGTSFGGFFAWCLAASLKVPSVLINPAVLPELVLPNVGWSQAGIANRQLLKLRAKLESYNPLCTTWVIGEQDEVIPVADREYAKSLACLTKLVTVPDGKHSGSTLPLVEIFRKEGAFEYVEADESFT